MPNILAHNYVTSHVLAPESPSITIGSVLPDFRGMYLARYGGSVEIKGYDKKLDAGIGFHKITDAIFDAQPEKPIITKPLAADLQAVGVEYYAARKAADLATDILLDRALLDINGPWQAFKQTTAAIMDGQAGLQKIKNRAFANYVGRYFETEAPQEYRDSQVIAGIIQRRLASRDKDHRHNIRDQQLPRAIEVIEAHAERAGLLGKAALLGTIKALSPPVK